MLKTILITPENNFISQLETRLQSKFPQVQVCGCFASLDLATSCISQLNPNLVVMDATLPEPKKQAFYFRSKNEGFEIIIVSENSTDAIEAVDNQLSGFLPKPICENRLTKVIQNVITRLKNKAQLSELQKLIKEFKSSNAGNQLIGIPTIEGFEFLKVSDIIRCQGLQKCTRIVTIGRSDIISSYNIGEFKKRLSKYRFFSPHKSHLINLKKVIRYNREGTIIMNDKSTVPVARRRKCIFLAQLEHL